MLLEILFVIFSVVCGDPQWYAGYGLTDEEVLSLLKQGCFHGHYGGGLYNNTLILSHCPYKKMKSIGSFSTTDSLCVIEFDPFIPEHLLQQAKAMITIHNHTKLLYIYNRYFVISSSYNIMELCHPDAFPKKWVSNTITVPSSPYRQPRQSNSEECQQVISKAIGPLICPTLWNFISFNLSDPDPVISKAIGLATKESQYGFVEKLSAFHTRQSNSEECQQAAEYIEEHYVSKGFEVSRFDYRENFAPVVIAELKGQVEPDTIIVVGAHYDSRSTNSQSTTQRAPGADDNGSGTANLLELARIIFESKLKFHNTIRLCSFAGEEQGLVGSRAYAKKLADDSENIIAMFNGDMLGYKLPNTPITLGMKDRYISEELLEQANIVSKLYVPELPIGSSSSCCSDHQAFTENGFPAIGFFEHPGSASDYPHYHKSTDLIGNIEFDQMLLESKAMMANALTFAIPIKN